MAKNTITDLRNHLFETIEALKDKESPMDVQRARAICEVAQIVVNTAKVEVQYIREAGREVGSKFLAAENEPNSESETSSRIPAGVARANRLEESTRRNGGAEKGLSTGKDLGAPINGHARTATA